MAKKDKRCIIISGGDEERLPSDTQDCFVIACDRGYAYAVGQGVHPDLLISDFDSYVGPVADDVPVRKFRSEKDDTDTMLAMKQALAQGFHRVEIYCGLGGRLDHLYANLQTLIYGMTHGAQCKINSEDTCIYGVKDGALKIPAAEGWSLSVFAVSDRCTGVNLRGVKYPLTDAVLTNDFPLGVSNEFAVETDSYATVAVKQGVLLVMVCRCEPHEKAGMMYSPKRRIKI